MKIVNFILFAALFEGFTPKPKHRRHLAEVNPNPNPPAPTTPSTPTPPPLVCDKSLMRAFQLWYDYKAPKQPNVLSPLIKQNCCSLQVQVHIIKKLLVNKELKQIIGTYKKMVQELSNSYDNLLEIQNKALAQDKSNKESYCTLMAETLLQIDVRKLKEQSILQAQKALQFLYLSRKGVTLSICGAELHPFFNREKSEIQLPFTFCKNMISNVMPYLHLRYTHIMKIKRIFPLYL